MKFKVILTLILVLTLLGTASASTVISSPRTPAHSLEGESIEFYVNLSNQANVSWYLNGNLLYTNTSVTSATYTNNSGVYGCCYNLTIYESYANETYTWWWSVGNDTKWKVSHPLSSTLSEYAHYMIKVDGDSWTLYNTTGGVEGSLTVDNFWEMVWGDLRGFGCYNESEQQHCYIQRDYENQVATIWVNLSADSDYLNVTYGSSSAQAVGTSWSGDNPSRRYGHVKEPYNVFDTFIDENRYEYHESAKTVVDNSELGGGHYGATMIDAGDKWVGAFYSHRTLAADNVINVMFSTDNGKTWQVNEFNEQNITVSGVSGDSDFPLDLPGEPQEPLLVPAPNGDILLLDFKETDAGARNGTAILRSSDGGLTWNYEGDLSPTNSAPVSDDNILTYIDYVVVNNALYISSFMDGVGNTGYAPGLFKSTDNGETWQYVSTIQVNDTGGEAGLTYIGNNTLMAVVREHPDHADTFLTYSYDMGETWTTPENIEVDLEGTFIRGQGDGIVQSPRLWTYNEITYLAGRSAPQGYTHKGYSSVWYTTDEGETWSDEYSPDVYYADTGYPSILMENESSIAMVKIAGPGSGDYNIDFCRFSPPHLRQSDDWYSSMFNLSDYMTVSKKGDYLRLIGNASGSGECKMENLTTSNEYVLDVEGYNNNTGTDDQYIVLTYDAPYADKQRFSETIHPKWDEQTNASYYNGADFVKFADWTENKEYIVRHRVNESDSTTGINYYLLETNYTQIASGLNQPFANGTPTDTDGLMIGDATGFHPSDIYLNSVNFRKDSDPSNYGSFSLINETAICGYTSGDWKVTSPTVCKQDVQVDAGHKLICEDTLTMYNAKVTADGFESRTTVPLVCAGSGECAVFS